MDKMPYKCVFIHGTIKERPREVYENKEKEAMIKLPVGNYDMCSWHKRKVAKDCHITLDNNYSTCKICKK